jgi:hypothetical protein
MPFIGVTWNTRQIEMGAIADSNDSRSMAGPDTFVSRHPIIGAIGVALGFAGIAGVIGFGYVTALSSLGLDPRSDALAVVGIIANLLLASGVVVLYLRQSAVLEGGLETLRRRAAREDERGKERREELEAIQQQTETLRDGMRVLAEQQRVQRSLYTPSLEIDRFRITDREDVSDTVRFAVTNLSAGDATNLTLQSEVSLIDAPDGYPINGRRSTCPLTRADRKRDSGRVPPRAEELDFETDVVVGVSEQTDEREHTITCSFSDSMRVFYEDGVNAIELSLELVYEDMFGDEYTEQIRLSRIDLTEETTLADVLRMDSRAEESTKWFRKQSMPTPSEH